MIIWRLTVLGAVLMVAAAARAQSQNPPSAVPVIPLGVPGSAVERPLTPPAGQIAHPANANSRTTPSAPSHDGLTVDQLIDQLATLRARKAELESQEQAVIEAIHERLRQQRARLAKLTVPEPAVRTQTPSHEPQVRANPATSAGPVNPPK